MATLLAIDTSGERIHAGVSAGETMWLAEDTGGARASANLLPCVRALLDRAGVALGDLDAIAFGRGPGAFTGLRAACSAVQGLAWGAGVPVLAVDTLMAVAEDARARIGADDVWVAMDARMGEVFAGRYRWSGNGWETLAAPGLVSPEAFNALCAKLPADWLAGSAAREFADRLQWPSASRIDADAQPAAGALLVCAREAWTRGAVVDPAAALPLYLRNKVALTTAERNAGALRANP